MTSIIVSNLPNDISDGKLNEFFSICGSISLIETINIGTTKKVKIKFNNSKAVETSLLLNNEKIFNNNIVIEEESNPDIKIQRRGSIDLQSRSLHDANEKREKSRTSSISTPTKSFAALSSISPSTSASGAPPAYPDTGNSPFVDEKSSQLNSLSGAHEDNNDISQEDKPKSVIIAQYLSQGYVLSDKLVNRAVEIDNERGISSKFKSFLSDLDSKYQISNNLSETDKKYKVSENFNSGLSKLDHYFDKVGDTSYGNKIHGFYLNLKRETKDVHEEARRLAELKKKQTESNTSST